MNQRERNHLDVQMLMLSQGDRNAFDQIYPAVWDHCYRFAHTILQKEEDAKDAAQNGLLKVFSRSYQYSEGRDALAWIFTFVAYECKTLMRKYQRRRESDIDPEQFFSRNETEGEVIGKRMRQLALSLISELKPMDQDAIIAVLDEEGPKSVRLRKRFERAIKRFKIAWEKKYGEKDSRFKI